MNKVNEWLFSGSTWTFTISGIATNWATIKSNILFFAGFVLIILQIIYHFKKIRNVKNEK